MTYLEGVARAAYEAFPIAHHVSWEGALDNGSAETSRKVVRAVLQAMREPSKEMLYAGATEPLDFSKAIWQAMIDVALEGDA